MLRWHQRLVLSVVAAVSLLLGPTAAAAAVSVADVRVGDHGERTRFVLELSAPVSYKIFSLTGPGRVVIDLPPLVWPSGSGQGLGSGLVASWRHGLFHASTSRLVLDLHRPAAVAQVFLIEPRDGRQYRLVVDLVPAAGAPVRAAAEPPRAMDMSPPSPPVAQAPILAAIPMPVPKPERVVRRPVVVLDAGHGGVDPGAISADGLLEKDVVLDVSRRLKAYLDATGRYEVRLTRDSDIFLPLPERVEIARKVEADLFLSVHADWINRPQVRGASIYTLSERASDEEAAALAARENSADVVAGIDLASEMGEVRSILIDLAQRETKNRSVRLARVLLPELKNAGRVLDDAHRSAGFRVLKAPDVPSVLVELGYLSNAQDAGLLRSSSGRAEFARALARGVDAFFGAGQI